MKQVEVKEYELEKRGMSRLKALSGNSGPPVHEFFAGICQHRNKALHRDFEEKTSE